MVVIRLILDMCIYSLYILNIGFVVILEVFVCLWCDLYFIIIYNLFGMFYCVDIIVMFVVYGVDKKNGIVYMVSMWMKWMVER